MHLYENLNQLLVMKKFEFWYVKVVEQERQQRDGMDLDGESVKRSVENWQSPSTMFWASAAAFTLRPCSHELLLADARVWCSDRAW